MMDLKDDIPAFVRFELRAVEDRGKTLAAGMYSTKDVEYVLITPPYSKDCIEKDVQGWLADLEQQVRQKRIPEGRAEAYKKKLELWRKGLEIPEDGVPIKGWTMISPATQQNLVGMGIRTVEALAKVNDEGMKRIGMGALDLKNRAAAYLKQASHGKLAQENAALKADLDTAKKTIEDMGKAVAELKRRLDEKDKVEA